MVLVGFVGIGLEWFGSVRFGLVWFGLLRVWFGFECLSLTFGREIVHAYRTLHDGVRVRVGCDIL